MKVLPLLLSAALLASCATPYQSSGFAGGFEETRLAPDVFRVSFAGNAYTRTQRAQDLAMLRAAELTLHHRFTHFALLNEQNEVAQQQFQTGGYATTTGTVYGVGQTAYYSGQTYYNPGQTITMNKPRTAILIRCFRSDPKVEMAFDAAFLKHSLKTKYKIK